ncbi:hypothetical protein JD844_008650 [Phrynosoma platyrhinos]|uniref:Uncharacterized protein n=1 Tax=Phrynosoma platyrhinos TaxID=52577 RepID=A0ABQ7TE39_PHRPL|nr:hypothetical protein JD844_008650 [Phrynosoma platyrhinos]
MAKEKVMYEKEAKQLEEKIEKMKTEDPDDYSIKKQVEEIPSLGPSSAVPSMLPSVADAVIESGQPTLADVLQLMKRAIGLTQQCAAPSPLTQPTVADLYEFIQQMLAPGQACRLAVMDDGAGRSILTQMQSDQAPIRSDPSTGQMVMSETPPQAASSAISNSSIASGSWPVVVWAPVIQMGGLANQDIGVVSKPSAASSQARDAVESEGSELAVSASGASQAQVLSDVVEQLPENEKELEETDEYKDAFSVLESIKLDA